MLSELGFRELCRYLNEQGFRNKIHSWGKCVSVFWNVKNLNTPPPLSLLFTRIIVSKQLTRILGHTVPFPTPPLNHTRRPRGQRGRWTTRQRRRRMQPSPPHYNIKNIKNINI